MKNFIMIFMLLFFAFPEQALSEVTRLSESTRKEIFIALVHADDRATREAEAKYPTNQANIPMKQLRTYDWEKAYAKNSKENKRLQKKYKNKLMKKYKISEAELKEIDYEAFKKKWPLPPMEK